MNGNLQWLCLNLIPPALSLVGLMILAAVRLKYSGAARGLGVGLTLSLLGSLVVAWPAILLVMSTDKSLGEGGLFTFFLAVVGAGVWLALLLGGYGVGYVIARLRTPPAEAPSVTP